MTLSLILAEVANQGDTSPDYVAGAAAAAAALGAAASGVAFVGLWSDDATLQAKYMAKDKDLTAPDAGKKVKERRGCVMKVFAICWVIAVAASVVAAVLAFTA